jgi:hypothetical protein
MNRSEVCAFAPLHSVHREASSTHNSLPYTVTVNILLSSVVCCTSTTEAYRQTDRQVVVILHHLHSRTHALTHSLTLLLAPTCVENIISNINHPSKQAAKVDVSCQQGPPLILVLLRSIPRVMEWNVDRGDDWIA